MFPIKGRKPQKGDASPAEVAAAVQLKSPIMPIARLAPAEAPRAITAAEKSFSAFETLQKAREDARLVGIRWVNW